MYFIYKEQSDWLRGRDPTSSKSERLGKPGARAGKEKAFQLHSRSRTRRHKNFPEAYLFPIRDIYLQQWDNGSLSLGPIHSSIPFQAHARRSHEPSTRGNFPSLHKPFLTLYLFNPLPLEISYIVPGQKYKSDIRFILNIAQQLKDVVRAELN